MRTTHILLMASFLVAGFLVGCKEKPSPSGSGTGPTPSSKGAWNLKERFALDTGIKKDDGKPTGTTGIAVSSDGKLALVMASVQAANVQVWDLQNRKKLYQYDNSIGSMLPVAISPDSKLGAYATQQSPAIILIDLSSGKEVRQLRKKNDVPLNAFTTGLAFSRKGDLLVVGSGREIVGWNPLTGEERFVWTESAEITALSAFFDDGKKIASGTQKGSLKVWDVAAGKVVQTLVEEGKEKISKVFVSPDGKRLGAYESYGPIKIWDLMAGKLEKELRGTPGLWTSMVFLPDNRTVAYNGDWDLVLQDTVSGEKKLFAQSREVRQYPIAVTPDGSTLLSGEEDARIKVWDVKPAP